MKFNIQCLQIGKSGSAHTLGGAHGRGEEGQSDPGDTAACDIYIDQVFL